MGIAEVIVMIAAEQQEFAGIATVVDDLQPLAWPLEYAMTGRWQGSEIALLANGPGPALAARAAHEALSRATVGAFISTGFCGALDPRLRVGDVLAANEVCTGVGIRYQAKLPLNPVSRGVVHSVDRVAITAAEKRALRQSGADAVEMEAAAVAFAAQQSNTDFYCIRVITDVADETMPLDFNNFRDSDGRFNRGQIAMAALRSPLNRIPALLRLQNNCRVAAGKLGEFIADCRF